MVTEKRKKKTKTSTSGAGRAVDDRGSQRALESKIFDNGVDSGEMKFVAAANRLEGRARGRIKG